MAPTKIDQGTLIILDMGRNVSEPVNKGEKSFYESAKECVGKIIERKIISQGKNCLGIILLGSKKSSDDFKYIELFRELQAPTWQMIRDLPEKPCKAKGNWFDALIVAFNHFQNGISGVKFMNKHIILITNFVAPCYAEDEDIDKVLAGAKENDFEIDVFGPDLYAETKNNDIDIAKKFVEGTNGTSASFEFIMRYLLFHKKKITNPTPWNIDLSIGPNIKIPVSAYIRVKDEPVVKNWLKSVRDPVTNTASTTEGIMKSKVFVNTDNKFICEQADLIKGYYYGQEIIPFSECDKSMLYDPGVKSLNVYGFTKASNISWQTLNGDGLSYLFGSKKDKKAQYTIKCLAECLHELNLVGVVRRVYNTGNAPKMYVLMPVIDTKCICLSLIGICYKEDLKNIAFPPTNTKKYACTDEQVNAFKNLIQAMDLTKAYEESEFDDTEAFPIAETVSPLAQYVMDCIAYRAMNPGKPLPPPREEIMMLFKTPPLIEKRAREPIQKLKSLFQLNKVEVKSKKIIIEPMDIDLVQPTFDEHGVENDKQKMQLNIVDKLFKVEKVETDPTIDFDMLKEVGKPFTDLCFEMSQAIERLIFGNIDGNFDKAFNAIEYFRNECVLADPSYYNNWLRDFKTELNDRKKTNILEILDKKKVNFIIKSENEKSTFINQDEDSQLYENDTMADLTEVTISTQINEMFADI
ncbi:X-ray repair cross-complementing protein 5 [Pieris rapae]|uniref:X-ray repair cross-complementing protein 5 n=1 Tax=Pieris rapae TaxID=64459 RepID=UPI001E27D0DD|nr:X-ray repair cross-complementing protein 5 [Pieris rapae]